LRVRQISSVYIRFAAFALGAVAVLGAGGIIAGITVEDEGWKIPLMLGGAIEILIAAGLGAALAGARGDNSTRATVAPQPPPAHTSGAAELGRIEHLMHELYDAMSVSEAARRELFAPRDLEVIHGRLEHALAMNDFAAAERSIEIAESLGHEALVPTLLSRIAEARRALQQAQAAEPMQAFENALARRDWAQAFQHAAAVRGISPDPATAAHLEGRVQAARADHKQALERQFLEAGERDDVETAMATLKELDRYMTREEAERLSQEAQRVIQRHRERLTATFQAAVQEKRWVDAARVGNSIIAEYPNTRMAEEVRTMIEVIRTRATQAALARE
jgi:hypothetical protein